MGAVLVGNERQTTKNQTVRKNRQRRVKRVREGGWRCFSQTKWEKPKQLRRKKPVWDEKGHSREKNIKSLSIRRGDSGGGWEKVFSGQDIHNDLEGRSRGGKKLNVSGGTWTYALAGLTAQNMAQTGGAAGGRYKSSVDRKKVKN